MLRTYKIVDKSGLHARPAALIVNKATSFEDDIFIEYKGEVYNLKSIMIVMSLGIRFGEEIKIITDKNKDILDSIETVLKENKIV